MPEINDPAIIEAIEAQLMLTVYRARRLARRQLRGLAAVPTPSPAALRLFRTGSLRQVAPRAVLIHQPRLRCVSASDFVMVINRRRAGED